MCWSKNSLIPALQKQGKDVVCPFEASLVYKSYLQYGLQSYRQNQSRQNKNIKNKNQAVLVHDFNLSNREAEAGSSCWVLGQSVILRQFLAQLRLLQRENLSRKRKNKK